jgi:hypothetical protein
LEQELIVGIMTHGSILKLHLASISFKLLNEQHLMNLVAHESIRGSDDHPIKYRAPHLFSKPVKSWTARLCSTVAIITKDVLLLPHPSLCLVVFPQTVELLFDRLCLSLCRNADIDRDMHGVSPVVPTLEWRETMIVRSLEAAAYRLEPTDAARQEPQSESVEYSIVVFSLISAFGQHICSVASEGV